MFGGIGYGFAPYSGSGQSVELGKVTGFSIGAFGTPTAFYNQAGDATGFAATVFGSHVAQYNQAQDETGWLATKFGAPFSPYLQTAAAQGFIDPQDFGIGSTHFAVVATGFSTTALGVVFGARVQGASSLAQQTAFGAARSAAVAYPTSWGGTSTS